MPLKRFFAELAWAGRAEVDTKAALRAAGDVITGAQIARDVMIEVDDGRITKVTPGEVQDAESVRLTGLTIPGLANAHSHAFQRALRGRTHQGAGDFWTWREAMYETASALDPDRYYALARATYAEMALAGITAVGEFHYLHHGPGGRAYGDPNEMGRALIAAARDAGIRITLLDCCYLRGGFDRPLDGVQVRFGDGDAERWAERMEDLLGSQSDTVLVAAAIHSVRAVDPKAMATVARFASEHEMPIHVHVSEQRSENEACLEATGHTPVGQLARTGVLGPSTTAIHATHLDEADVVTLGRSGAHVCMCPTTERDLADGVGPARALARAGSPLCLGTDSHASIDLFEEARAVELDERLITERRGHHRAPDLLHAATAAGMQSLGWNGGVLEPGAPADFVTLDLASVRLAGVEPSSVLEHLVFAASAADVVGVIVGGEQVVAARRHTKVPDVARSLSQAIKAVVEPAAVAP